MNIPLILIAALIIFLANLLQGAPLRQPRSPEHRSSSRTVSKNMMIPCITSVEETLQFTKEQKNILDTLRNELRLQRTKATESLENNKKKIQDALTKQDGRAQAEQLLAENSTIIINLHKKEMDIMTSLQAMLDEKQKRRLQRIREDRSDNEQSSNNTPRMPAFAMSFGETQTVPSILPPEEAQLLQVNEAFSFGRDKTMAFNFRNNDYPENFDFHFSIPEDEYSDEEEIRAIPRMEKKEQQKLEESMRELEKRLKELEKRLQKELRFKNDDEI